MTRIFATALVFLLIACRPSSALADDPNRFLDAGIAASDREWHGPEYARAAEVVAAGKVKAPRLGDPAGRALFARIVSVDNLALERNRTLPLQARMQDFTGVLQATSAIAKIYVGELMGGQEVHAETIRLVAFMVHVAAAGVGLTDEFVPTIPKDDKYAARMEGLRKFNAGLATVFSGAVTTLGEKGYAPEDRAILVAAMESNLPVMRKAFSPDFRVELRKRLAAHRASFTRDEDVRRIDNMIAELDK